MRKPRASAVVTTAGIGLQIVGGTIAYFGFLALLAPDKAGAAGPLTAMGWGGALTILGTVLLVTGIYRALSGLDFLVSVAPGEPVKARPEHVMAPASQTFNAG